MSRINIPVVLLALALLLGFPAANAHKHRKLMANPVARPGVLKGFQLKPASGSSGDEVVAQEVDTQYAGAIQRSMQTSGFKGSQAKLVAQLRNDADLVSAVLLACKGLGCLPTHFAQQLAALTHASYSLVRIITSCGAAAVQGCHGPCILGNMFDSQLTHLQDCLTVEHQSSHHYLCLTYCCCRVSTLMLRLSCLSAAACCPQSNHQPQLLLGHRT
jgi:hypothetical protein